MPLPVEIDTGLKVGEILTLLFGGLGLFYRMGRMTMKFEQIGIQQGKEISDLKKNVEATNGLLVTLTQVRAEITGQLGRLEDRLLAEGKRLDELSRRMNRVSEDSRVA